MHFSFLSILASDPPSVFDLLAAGFNELERGVNIENVLRYIDGAGGDIGGNTKMFANRTCSGTVSRLGLIGKAEETEEKERTKDGYPSSHFICSLRHRI